MTHADTICLKREMLSIMSRLWNFHASILKGDCGKKSYHSGMKIMEHTLNFSRYRILLWYAKGTVKSMLGRLIPLRRWDLFCLNIPPRPCHQEPFSWGWKGHSSALLMFKIGRGFLHAPVGGKHLGVHQIRKPPTKVLLLHWGYIKCLIRLKLREPPDGIEKCCCHLYYHTLQILMISVNNILTTRQLENPPILFLSFEVERLEN